DGTSSTLIFAECGGRNMVFEMGQQVPNGSLGEAGAWANPGGHIEVSGFNPTTRTKPGPVAINGCNSQNVYSFHPNLAGGGFADGSVRFLKSGTSLDVLIALVTRASGEVIAADNY